MASTVVNNHYSLSIWIYSDGFSLYVYDENNHILSSKHLNITEGADEIEFLQQALASQEEINAEYKEIMVTCESAYHTIIPEIFHTTKKENDFLTLQHPDLPASYQLFHEKDTNLQTVLIYGIDVKIIEAINKYLPTANITSHLVHATKKVVTEAVEKLTIWVRDKDKEMDCIVYKNNKISLLNKYFYQSSEDIIYHIVNIYQQLELNPAEFETEIFDDGEILNETFLRDYFTNINLSSKKSFYEDHQREI